MRFRSAFSFSRNLRRQGPPKPREYSGLYSIHFGKSKKMSYKRVPVIKKLLLIKKNMINKTINRINLSHYHEYPNYNYISLHEVNHETLQGRCANLYEH